MSATWRRRALTIPALLFGSALWVAALPLAALIAAVHDLARGGSVGLRAVAMVTAYVLYELAGLAASGGLWLRRALLGMSAERWEELHFRLQAWWGHGLFRAVETCFGLRVEVEGLDALTPGPYLLLPRHTSAADTLIASAFVAKPLGMWLRYVLKRELLWDPCLDVVGLRLPHVFVSRDGSDSAGEIARVRKLGEGLGPSDGVLIYPEGTRFTQEKRRRVLQSLESGDDAELLETARSLRHLLPPRRGGTLALLDAAPEADVVLCAHTGLEGAGSLARVVSGELVGARLRVRFTRVARDEIPKEPEGAARWLLDTWQEIDAWVERAST